MDGMTKYLLELEVVIEAQAHRNVAAGRSSVLRQMASLFFER